MPGYEKAKLQEIDANDPPNVVATIPLQFNPQTLRLALANNLGPQETRGQLPRQYLGKTSTSLSFELQFDTSDEGTTDAPVSVRTRTADLERFVLPKEERGKKDKPPKARFIWNELQLDGIIESLSIDFDLFASNGVPLRAKMSVTMTEQDAKYQAAKGRGAGASAAGSTAPGCFGFSAGVGLSAGVSIGASASVGVSLGAPQDVLTFHDVALADAPDAKAIGQTIAPNGGANTGIRSIAVSYVTPDTIDDLAKQRSAALFAAVGLNTTAFAVQNLGPRNIATDAEKALLTRNGQSFNALLLISVTV